MLRGILEPLSQIGHRDIARSRPACVRALFAAGGAGLVTAATVIFKSLILHSALSRLASTLLGTLNFSASFLCIQAFGFRLATKQPSYFGLALWRTGKPGRGELGWGLRTQLLCALGNLTFVIPGALCLHLAHAALTGAPFLDPEAARASLRSLDPCRGATLAGAALTGLLLWLCTLAGGAVASRFRPFSKVLAVLCFNVALGAALAFVPAIGRQWGLPLLDVRHFTLSGGTVAVATASLGLREALRSGLGRALWGVLAIGALNFTVSFALAFAAAWSFRNETEIGLASCEPRSQLIFSS